MYLASWSGGKDSCLACWKAIQSGHQISHIVNFISAEYKRVSFHGTPATLIQKQAESIGIPLFQKETGPDDYEPAFKEAVNKLRIANCELRNVKSEISRLGLPDKATSRDPVGTGRNSQSVHGESVQDESEIRGMVFGDIYLQGHKQWVERICGELGIQSEEPLWGRRTEDILDEFIKSGFEALIISAKATLMSKEWIGQIVNYDFINYLKKNPYIDLCGENGEYHTFVVNGPLFRKKIEITRKEVIEKDTPYGRWYFLDITPTD